LNETFDATISRFSGKVDHATRTMLTEADVENRDGHLKPGVYASATLVLQTRENVIAVPVEAISVGEKASVFVVARNNLIENRPIKLGLQTPTRAEVLEGLRPGDLVVIGSRAGIEPGQKVIAKLITAAAAD
jgi:RND family efflux transporter MFP subunit